MSDVKPFQSGEARPIMSAWDQENVSVESEDFADDGEDVDLSPYDNCALEKGVHHTGMNVWYQRSWGGKEAFRELFQNLCCGEDSYFAPIHIWCAISQYFVEFCKHLTP